MGGKSFDNDGLVCVLYNGLFFVFFFKKNL